MAQRVGVVLAGGAGLRLGRTKGDLVVPESGGTPLAERAARVLWPFCSSVVISIAPGTENPAPGHPAIEDSVQGNGPLAGLDAVFRDSGTADLLVLACDYPRVEISLMRRLVTFAAEGTEDLVMLTDPAGRDHPLVAAWRRSAAPVVREAVEAGRFKVRGLLVDFEVRRLGPTMLPGIDLGRALLNVNWPDDLKKL